MSNQKFGLEYPGTTVSRVTDIKGQVGGGVVSICDVLTGRAFEVGAAVIVDSTFNVFDVCVVHEAKISSEHQFFVFLISAEITSLPLVLGGVIEHMSLVDPSLTGDGPVVVVVEDSGLVSFTPPSIISGVLWLCASNGMGSRNGGGEWPSIVSVEVNVIDKDIAEAGATILWIWHSMGVPVALLLGCTAICEIVSELLQVSSLSKWVRCVNIGGCISHSGFGNNNHEVSERDLAAPVIIDVEDTRLGNA